MITLATAKTKYIKITPRKLQVVAKLIRGKNYSEAIKLLKKNKKLSAKVIWQTLDSAVSNAKNLHKLTKEELCIDEIFVTKGSILKRGRPRAQGKMFKIQKHTSHLIINLKKI